MTKQADESTSLRGLAEAQVPSWQRDGRTPPGATRLLVGVVAGHAIKHVFNSGFYVLLPEIKAALGLSNAAIGTLSTVRAITGGLANAPAGYLADRYAPHMAVMLAGIFVIIGLLQLALGSAVAYWQVVVLVSLINVLVTAWHPPAMGTLAKVFARRRGFAISLHGTGASVGEVVGPLLVGGLLLLVSWRTVLQGSVFPAVVAGLAVWYVTRAFPIARAATSVRSYVGDLRRLLATPRLLLVLTIAGGFAAAQAAVSTFLPVYVREDLGRSPWVVGVYLALAQVAGIGAQPVLGYLLDYHGRRAVITPSLFVLAGALGLLYVSGDGALFIVGLLVTGAFIFSMTAMLVTAASDVAGDAVQGTSVSLVFGAAALFTGLGALASGFVADAAGTRTVFLFAACCAGASAVLAATTRWSRR